jgi:transcriptional regulator with XRE-family HTH domain
MPDQTPAPEATAIGEALARNRRRRGLTQEGLAERAEVSVSVIRKLERGDRTSASLPTLRKLATALRITTVDLFQPTPRLAGRVDPDDRDDLYAIRRVLQPARSINPAPVVTLADDAPPDTDAVRDTVREVNGMFRDSEYAAAVAALPTAITHIRAAVDATEGADRDAVWAHLAQAYQTAALVLIQVRRDDLAYHALGLAMDAGRQAGDDILVASAVCGENWLLTRQARFDEAESAALVTAEAVEPSLTRSPLPHIAVWGWLNLGAAAAAARNGRSDMTSDALRRARAAAHVAAPYRSPDVAHWSQFSPAVVAMREVELAVVAGDIGTALRVARDVPSNAKPAVTFQRFQLDVAAAHLEERDYDKASEILLRLRSTVPGWLRHQRYARSLTDRLLHARPRSIPTELRELADFLDLD